MKASAIEFRLRMWIQIVIVFLGFWAPWLGTFDLGRRIATLEWLALEISRLGLVSFTVATPIVIVLGALAAAIGAVLRVWGAAYLGYNVVHHGQMQGGAVMAAGPFRYLRNPLYLGGWFMMLAISLLMPPSRRALYGGAGDDLLSAPDPGRRGVPGSKTRRALQGISAPRPAFCPAAPAAPAWRFARRGGAAALAHRPGHRTELPSESLSRWRFFRGPTTTCS